MYVRLFSAAWLLLCIGLAFVAWGFKAPFSYDPVGPRAYPLLLLALMGTAALWLLFKPKSGQELAAEQMYEMADAMRRKK